MNLLRFLDHSLTLYNLCKFKDNDGLKKQNVQNTKLCHVKKNKHILDAKQVDNGYNDCICYSSQCFYLSGQIDQDGYPGIVNE